MEYCQEALRKLLRLFKLESDASEPEVKNPGTAAALITNNGVGVGACHGDSFGLPLNRERRLGNWCARLL
jgi:hypothetical protein